jgi:hypothetical protein
VTEVFAFIVTVHVPVPTQPPPLHPAKTEPASGAAVSVTVVPVSTEVEQVAPQLIVPGELVTVPEPAPVLLTDSVNVGAGEKVAVAVSDEVWVVKVQTFEAEVQLETATEGDSVQPPNTDPAAGVAVSDTFVPVATEALVQVPLAQGTVPLTLPVPAPARVTDTGKALAIKLAVTDLAWVIDTVQFSAVPKLAQVPPQPPN